MGMQNKKPKQHWVPGPLSSSAFVPWPTATARTHTHAYGPQPRTRAHGPLFLFR